MRSISRSRLHNNDLSAWCLESSVVNTIASGVIWDQKKFDAWAAYNLSTFSDTDLIRLKMAVSSPYHLAYIVMLKLLQERDQNIRRINSRPICWQDEAISFNCVRSMQDGRSFLSPTKWTSQNMNLNFVCHSRPQKQAGVALSHWLEVLHHWRDWGAFCR